MHTLTIYLIRRLRPRAGWPVALLALLAAACPAVAATGASLPLPAGLILLAGLAGAAIGLRLAGLRGRAWWALYAAAGLALAAALLLAARDGLPPAAILWRDARALAAAAAAWAGGAAAAPQLLTPRFLALSLPRALQALAGAPAAGEAGAALIVGALALVSTQAGATALGWAAASGRGGLAWGLPLTGALGLTTILGGGDGAGLVLGLAAALGLAGAVGHAARERAWDRAGFGYSDELRWGVLGWGLALAGGALMLALAVPTSLPRLPARGAGPLGDLPSGLAAIESRVEQGRRPQADPGLSQLPPVSLGVSLSDAPPETVALRVRLGAPLPPGPWPRYWRARALNVYTGRAWWADARAGAGLPADDAPAAQGAVVQEVELVERASPLLVALPDVVGLDLPASVERLADGSIAAVAGDPAARRYRAVSLPQDLAPPADYPGGPQGAPPAGQESLGLPAGLPPRVGELARSVTAGAAGPLAQALALEAYLRELPYAYEVRPIPAGGDAVDQFLFEMRQGYCTYYASAMAVMARSLGIPARVAVGYATGSYDAALGAYVVREAEAHAWPELLIGGRWLPFEPTPVRPLPARGAAPPEPEPAPAPAPPRPAPRVGDMLAPALGALALAALAAAAWLLAARGPRLSPTERAQRWLERQGARAGVPWPAGATLHEYGGLLAARGLAPREALAELVALIEAARYSGRPLSAAQGRRLRAAVGALRRSLRTVKKPPPFR